MSEVVSMINNMKAPGSQPKQKARKSHRRALVFDGVLEYPEFLMALQSAGFDVVPKSALASATVKTPELIVAEIHELDVQDRRAIESLRQANPQIFVIGIGRPLVVALSKGRRNGKNFPERRGGSPHRRVFDEFVSSSVDAKSLLELLKVHRPGAHKKTTK